MTAEQLGSPEPFFSRSQEVWTPAGGWWTNPHNWRTNTAYAMLGIAFVGYGIFKFSAEHEVSPPSASSTPDFDEPSLPLPKALSLVHSVDMLACNRNGIPRRLAGSPR